MLDGAMGTALRRRGLSLECLPEEWVLKHPQEIARVHTAHALAGARVVLTCTFNAARLEHRGLEEATELLCQRAVVLARAARTPLVAGCVGSTGLVTGTGQGPPDEELRQRFCRAFRALARAGADLLWTETHVCLREARAALAAARRTGRNAVATMSFVESDEGMTAVDGTPGDECLVALWRDGACAVGVNCVAPGRALSALVARAAARVGIPLVVKPHAGLTGEPIPPAVFAARVFGSLRAGAALCGGCCGTTADHLRALPSAMARA